MNKVIKVILIIVLIIALGIGAFFGIKFIKSKKSGVPIETTKVESTLEWKQMETVEEINYIPNVSAQSKDEILICGLNDTTHIDIRIPERHTVNLFGSSVYAVDGSYSILLTKNNGNLDVASTINRPQKLSEDVVCTSDGEAVVHVVTKNLGDYNLTAYVYSNSNDWSIIRDMVEGAVLDTNIHFNTNVTNISIEDIKSVGSTVELVAGLNDTMVPEDTYLKEGIFRSMQYPTTYKKAVNAAEEFIALMSKGKMITKYIDSEIAYLETDDFAIGIINSGTESYVKIMYAIGEQAKQNIKGLLI